jgi:hypothetical protein
VVSVSNPDDLSIVLAKEQAEKGDLATAEWTFDATAKSGRPAVATAAFNLGHRPADAG